MIMFLNNGETGMKEVKVSELVGNEILALPLVSGKDIVLVHSDVVLNKEIIEKISRMNVESVFIKDENDISSVEEDANHIYKVEETVENSKEVVQHILEKHIDYKRL